MEDLECVMLCLCHTVVFGIILLNGVGLIFGMSANCQVLRFAVMSHLLCRPASHKELFNLCHAQGRNVIEHIFGVIKQCWEILNHPPQFGMSTQARIPPACAALHNFIMDHDPNDVRDLTTACRVNDREVAAGNAPLSSGELATMSPV
jgi:hypothetical protein